MKNSKKNAIITILLLSIIIVLITSLSIKKKQAHPKLLLLQEQTSIKNYLKISAKPTSINSDNIITFKISFETYQKPDFLDIDVLKIVFLEDEFETPSHPQSWKETNRTKYTKKGLLKFPLNKNQNTLKLTIFELEERSFTWNIQNKTPTQNIEKQTNNLLKNANN
jgi:hypothetical protein